MSSIREGSSLYYSLLWTDERARQRFAERLDLIHALASTLDDVQDPQVAERKIHWWHEEIQRLIAGEGRHPASKATQAALFSVDGAQDSCLAVLSAASTMRFTPSATAADADALIIQSHQARIALLCHALSENPNDLHQESHSGPLALALGKYEQLARLPHAIHRGLPVFSDETYQAAGLNATDLAAQIRVSTNHSEVNVAADSSTQTITNHPAIEAASPSLRHIPIVVEHTRMQSFLAAAIDDAFERLNHAIDDRQLAAQYRQTPYFPIWRLLVLRHRQVTLWQRKQPNLLREKMTLTPLVKLYIAWRNKG